MTSCEVAIIWADRSIHFEWYIWQKKQHLLAVFEAPRIKKNCGRGKQTWNFQQEDTQSLFLDIYHNWQVQFIKWSKWHTITYKNIQDRDSWMNFTWWYDQFTITKRRYLAPNHRVGFVYPILYWLSTGIGIMKRYWHGLQCLANVFCS